MTDASPLKSMRCPNCGAPLDFQPGQTSVRCRFCDSVIEHSADAVSSDDQSRIVSTDPVTGYGSNTAAGQPRRYVIKIQNGMPVVIDSSGAASAPTSFPDPNAPSWQGSFGSGNVASIPVMTTQPAAQRSSNIGCIVAFAIAALVLCGVVPAIIFATTPSAAVILSEVLSGNIQQALGNAGSIGARIILDSSGTLVSGANDGPAEAVMLTTQYPATSSDTKEVRLVDLNTSTRKLNWQTGPLDQQLNDTPILANTDFVYILDSQQIIAVRRTDGTVAWQATLADKIDCTNCLQLIGTHLAALSTDGTLEVLDAATGKSLWNVQSKQASPSELYVLGQRVAFLDQDSKNNGIVRAFDLDTGKETSVQPTCQASDPNIPPDYLETSTPLSVSPQGKDFYILFGYSSGCAQRWDAQSLQMVWSTDLKGNLGNPKPVFSDDTLYLAGNTDVLALAIDGGAEQTVTSNPDYNFEVMSTHGSDVIVQAKRQRGTAQYEIWAINGTSGQTHWKFSLGEKQPLDPGGIIDDTSPVWMTQPSLDGLRVLQFQSASDNKSYKLLQDVLNWDTGQSAGQKVTPLNLDTIILTAPDWNVWKNNTMWLEMNNELLAFDAAQNKITFTWP